MFSLFPIHRPRIGVSVRAHALDLVEVQRRWRRPPLVRRRVSRPLPPGLLTPSWTTLNVSDPEALVRELQALCEGVRDRTVAIDLPIACGTLGLFHFETFPPSRVEQDTLLQWRFRQEEHIVANDLRVMSQVFESRGQGSPGTSVLAVAIRQSVVDQYHRVCDAADVLPVSMGFSTVHLLDLYRRVMPARSEGFFAHRTADALLVLGFQHSRPVLLRVKPLRRAHVELQSELISTLQFFDRQFPHRSTSSEAACSPLYIVDEGGSSAQGGSPAVPEVWTPTDNPDWTVEVTRVQWSTAPITSTLSVTEPPPFGALAGVLAS